MTTAISDDRRHHSRITFHTTAHLLLGDRRIEVKVLDLSLKGALIQLSDAGLVDDAVAGLICQLNVGLDDAEGDQITMETKVAHAHGSRIGLLCRNIDLDSVTHLRRLVELNLGDPGLLERELSALIAE
jgi:hypothetical protein